MRVVAVMSCLCLCAGSLDARLIAQELPTLRPGMRLRVNAPGRGKPVVGTLTAIDDTLLTLQTSKQVVLVPRESIRKVQLSQRRSWKLKGALIGAAVGALAAVVVAATDKQEPFLGGDPLLTRDELGLYSALLFVPAGAGLGALIAPGERWTVVPSPGAAAAQRDRPPGLALSVRLRF